jgi:hypothetical protein
VANDDEGGDVVATELFDVTDPPLGDSGGEDEEKVGEVKGVPDPSEKSAVLPTFDNENERRFSPGPGPP